MPKQTVGITLQAQMTNKRQKISTVHRRVWGSRFALEQHQTTNSNCETKLELTRDACEADDEDAVTLLVVAGAVQTVLLYVVDDGVLDQVPNTFMSP